MPFDKVPLFSRGKRHNPVKQGALKWRGICVSVAAAAILAGCAGQNAVQMQPAGLAAPKKNLSGARKSRAGLALRDSYSGRLTERRCLERAMFFESNRSSRDGLIAVGTVVMNRVHSSQYPNTICSVVGQKSQFAPGVLTRPMNLALVPDVAAAADAVLRGERSPKLGNTMYFHTAGLRFPYKNMHYVLVAGGNSFYEKRGRDGRLTNPVNDETYDVAYAFAQDRGEFAPVPAAAALDGAAGGATDPVTVASVEPSPRRQIVPAYYRSAAHYDNAAAEPRANEAQAELVSYAPDSVPVPQLKAVYRAESEKRAPPQSVSLHFMPLSAPQNKDGKSGFIGEAGGSAAAEPRMSVSYKAPDTEKAGEVGALLLGGGKP